ncbi:hypothetical protein HHK36_005730 [Tetracentron sinense]|uniref:Wax synthase domain-containing protein n=1 Tax=Tetracentron sinense TaxID=13715 RepID=A0A835DRB2_TETSI|nr:hypothetical protein HHK36_005730 [Tetracentron sinense]
MRGETKSFMKVWLSVLASMWYCYFVARKIPKGKIRLLSLLPIFVLFSLLPLNLSSVNLIGPTAFFITWLANFKLLLFSFDQGPLSSNPPHSMLRFISLACLPINIKTFKTDPSPQSPTNIKIKDNLNSKIPTNGYGTKSPLNLATKALLSALLIPIYGYKQHIHPNIILVLYCCHIYFELEIVLAMCAALARALLGLELEPQFDEPYLSTSLQDFWGKRWNLMVTSILRPTVYNPIRSMSARLLGSEWALMPAMVATFVASGLIHELIFFYLTRATPTWEVTWFFVLHGICTALEVLVKKSLTGRWRLHRAVSRLLAVGFVVATSIWLFFPQMIRNGVDVRGIEELGDLVEFVKEMLKFARVRHGV